MLRSKNVAGLLVVLPVLAGGIVGCESYSKPTGATAPIADGTAPLSGSNRGGGNWHAGNPAPAATPAPAPRAAASEPAPARASTPAPAAAPAAAPMTGASVAYYPTGNRASSCLMIEKMVAGETAAGVPVDYVIRATNICGSKIDNVVVEDGKINGFNITSATPQPGTAGNNWTWNLGSLNAGESKNITIKGAFAQAGSYSTCGSGDYSVPVCMTVNVVSPALKLTKTAPAEGTPCDVWPVTLTVTNSGTGTARGVTLNDPLPAGLKIVGATPNWNVGDLASGASREVKFNVQADKTGTFANTATATAQGGLTATSNTTNTVIKQAVLTIDKKCPDRIRIGQNMKFDIVVTNTGSAVATSTVVRDAMPAGTRFVSATEGGAVSGNDVVWNLGNLNPGQSRTLSVTFTGGAQGSLQNTASASATCANAVSDSCTVTLAGVPDIGTGIEDSDGVVTVGQPHTYIYTVVNQGQVNLTNVKVVFTPEAGLEFVSTTAAGGATNAGGAQSVNLGTLNVGQRATFNIVYRGTKAGDLILQSVTTSDQTRAVRNDEQVNYVD
jgi:uncharacterized repeat protein (TIGR01451 family)